MAGTPSPPQGAPSLALTLSLTWHTGTGLCLGLPSSGGDYMGSQIKPNKIKIAKPFLTITLLSSCHIQDDFVQ